MNHDNNDRFRIRPGAPRQRDDTFINKVLCEASRAGSRTGTRGQGAAPSQGKTGRQPGARLGRGHIAARFAGGSLTPNARRATVKARLVNLRRSSLGSTAAHLRYIERDGVDRQGGAGRAYGEATDEADLAAFSERGQGDRHQFRFIVSAEDAAQLDDLKTFTRNLMVRVEADLGTHVDWVAVDHWNTDNPHTHVVVRGKDDTGKDLIIARDYIAQGMRMRVAELATEWLGPRTELEIQRTLAREVDQERWTGLDRTLRQEAGDDGVIGTQTLAQPHLRRQRQLLIGRLQRLQRMGLVDDGSPGEWRLRPEAEPTLRAIGERGDILRTMQRAMAGQRRELAVFEPGQASAVIGRVSAKGLADELDERGYLVVDGIDGKAHYLTLAPGTDLAQYPMNAVVEARDSTSGRTIDKAIVEQTVDGLYRSMADDTHGLGGSAIAQLRRLETLRRAGIIQRLSDGVWQVPHDLPERGRQHDLQRLQGGVAVELKSHLPIERQAHALGVTWLDQQLIADATQRASVGFGSEVEQALQHRTDFLADQGLAQRQGSCVVVARNLLATLRGRELEAAGRDIAGQSGLIHRPVTDGQRVNGVYRRSVQLVSGRFAMLDDGMGFSLVPWRPVIEPRLGQQVAAVVRGGGVSWEIGRQRGLGVG